MELFYSHNIINNQIILDAEESWHCVKVKRLKSSEIINVTDGKGKLYVARIEADNPMQVFATIVSEIEKNNNNKPIIYIAIAPPKHPDRFEWFVEKATEIGVDYIIPMITERTERIKFKNDRLQKIIIAASKQSLRFQFPLLKDAIPYKNLINEQKIENCFIAHCNQNVKPSLKQLWLDKKNVMVLIGPEGDFTNSEVELALANGYKEINLGNYRLRTETAAIYALASLMALNGETYEK